MSKQAIDGEYQVKFKNNNSGQSYYHSTIVNYDTKVVLT